MSFPVFTCSRKGVPGKEEEGERSHLLLSLAMMMSCFHHQARVVVVVVLLFAARGVDASKGE